MPTEAQILKTEILTDPLTRGYSGMSDQQVADDLNTAYRTRPRTTVRAAALFARLVSSEYAAALAAGGGVGTRNGTMLSHLLGQGEIDPSDANVAALITTVFGGGSDTVANITGAVGSSFPGDDLRVELISRATELGLLETMTAGHVTVARS